MLLIVFNSLVNCTTSMFAFLIAFFFMSTIKISIRCEIWGVLGFLCCNEELWPSTTKLHFVVGVHWSYIGIFFHCLVFDLKVVFPWLWESFMVTTGANQTLTSMGVAPPNWGFGQTYQGSQVLWKSYQVIISHIIWHFLNGTIHRD
jgi:hypothetical protein